MGKRFEGIAVGGPADGKPIKAETSTVDVANPGIGIYRYTWFGIFGGIGVWASASMSIFDIIAGLVSGYRPNVEPNKDLVASTNALRKDRDELAARVRDLCNEISRKGGRISMIAASYGWRGGDNNIEFIERKMREMQEEIDALRKPVPTPRVEVAVTGMADLEKRVKALEGMAHTHTEFGMVIMGNRR